jgi:tyrosyl-tRNA synthetase
MSIGDELVGEYAQVYTDLPLPEVRRLRDDATAGGTAARDAKLGLAEAVVARYHGAEAARRCRLGFTDTFAQGNEPRDMPELKPNSADPSLLALVKQARPADSNTELRRLITQGAVSLNGTKLTDPELTLTPADGDTLRIGRRTWHRIRREG